MTVADFKVTSAIDQLASDLQAISEEFGEAEDFSDVLADAVGHDDLADEVRDFAKKWNDKRKEMKGNVDGIHALVKALGDNTGDIDRQLNQALEDAGKGGK